MDQGTTMSLYRLISSYSLLSLAYPSLIEQLKEEESSCPLYAALETKDPNRKFAKGTSRDRSLKLLASFEIPFVELIMNAMEASFKSFYIRPSYVWIFMTWINTRLTTSWWRNETQHCFRMKHPSFLWKHLNLYLIYEIDVLIMIFPIIFQL